jgi:hypothetical protein
MGDVTRFLSQIATCDPNAAEQLLLGVLQLLQTGGREAIPGEPWAEKNLPRTTWRSTPNWNRLCSEFISSAEKITAKLCS